MIEKVIGRDDEKQIMLDILHSENAELLAIYGRRRVGKTFLIRNIFEDQIIFEFSGIHDANTKIQLENFSLALSAVSGSLPLAIPANWLNGFKMLTEYLTPLLKKKRQVIFFDEFPWIHSPRSGFLQAFENFWNSWAVKQHNLIVVICGSSASWMIQKVVNNRGGLHNRVTKKIRLLPFTIAETELFLKSRNIKLDRYQILQVYMVMGGIPHYLKEIQKGESTVQAIDRICFTKDGLLFNEFKNLYDSLFDNAGNHLVIIRALAKKASGLTRQEIIEASKITSGGGMTRLLDELTESGFITPYIPFDTTVKNCIYKLTDEYSLFYIKFIENKKSSGKGTWIKYSTGNSWRVWSGIAFESICMKHVVQIKIALGIAGVYSETSVWRGRNTGDDPGVQIDLLIDRQDKCINLCEIKFSVDPFVLNTKYALELKQKEEIFRAHTQTRKSIFLTLISPHGIKNGDTFAGLIQNDITMDALFKHNF